MKLEELVTSAIRRQVLGAGNATRYREPLIGFDAADDPRFAELRRKVEATHMLQAALLGPLSRNRGDV